MHNNSNWGPFHYDDHAILQNRDGSENDKNGEDKGTNGIHNFVLRIEENNQSSDQDTNALNNIACLNMNQKFNKVNIKPKI